MSSWSWFSVGFEENLPLTKPCDDRKRFFSVASVEKRDGNGAFPIIVIHWDSGSFFVAEAMLEDSKCMNKKLRYKNGIRYLLNSFWFRPNPLRGGERKKNDTINHQASICRPVVQLFTPRKFVDNNKAMFYLLTNLFLSRPLLLQNPPKQIPKVGPNPCSGPDVVLSRVEVETTNEA